MPVQMTRAEYEAKYGQKPSAVDTAPSVTRMTRAEYELKYGTPAPAPAPAPQQSPSIFGNPAETIRNAGAAVSDAISGSGPSAGQNPIVRGFQAAESAASAIPEVAADVVPFGRAALDVAGKGIDAAVSASANVPNLLADTAEKLGLMSKEQRAAYDKRNADFADSPLGTALSSAASVGNSAGNISNVILMAAGAAHATEDILDNRIPAAREAIKNTTEQENAAKNPAEEQAQRELIDQTAGEIANVEQKYSNTRNANDYSKDGGTASRQRIAASGVLKYTIDNDGVIRTTDKGGAVDQYRAMTVKPAEGVVYNALVKEGSKVLLSDIEKALTAQVEKSSLEGADLVAARNGVKRELAGLALKADAKGYVPTSVLQRAKVNTTDNINYQTPPETQTYRKAVARGYKQLIEQNSNFNVAEVNAELAKYYDDIARLERLDGKRVTGGRLGKYTAQLTGNIVGGAVGSIFGPFGTALGSIVGGEVTSAVKGRSMAGTFDSGAEPVKPESEVLDAAIREAGPGRQGAEPAQ